MEFLGSSHEMALTDALSIIFGHVLAARMACDLLCCSYGDLHPHMCCQQTLRSANIKNIRSLPSHTNIPTQSWPSQSCCCFCKDNPPVQSFRRLRNQIGSTWDLSQIRVTTRTNVATDQILALKALIALLI